MMRRQQTGNQNQSLPPSRSAAGKSRKSPQFDTITWIIILLASCCISFYAGIWMAWAITTPQDDRNGVSQSYSSSSTSDCAEICLNALIGGKGELANKLDGKLDAILEQKIEKALETDCPKGEPSDHSTKKRFSSSLSHFSNGLVSINRKDLFDTYDFGVPMDPNAEDEDVLMMYDSRRGLPSDKHVAIAAEHGGEIPHTDAASATSNCDTMNVIFVKNPSRTLRQCVAIVGGQYQGYHIQKWMRLIGEGPSGKTDRNAPLRVTGRMTKSSGYDELMYPKPGRIDLHQNIMLAYLTNAPKIRSELGRLLQRIAIDNTVIVSTVNKGQSELLMNFVCSARSRGFDLSNFILFPTDEYSKNIAEKMGIATYYAEELMAIIPDNEAARYGDVTFGLVMMAKVICVQLVSELGFDMLFQDVDVIWYKNPLNYFHDKTSAIANFDVYFQDDGNRQERYAPYSANSGFYYIRNNERSKLLFRTMFYSGDLIFACRSHQQILIMLLAEANSLSGLRVKVLSRDDDSFPGGYHYHMRKDDFMKQFVRGEIDPYIFHMSWTLNKDDKLKFLEQMGMWYVKDYCTGQEGTEILGENAAGVNACCSAEPIIRCHYRDEPSIKSCAGFPPKDKGGRSFW